MQFEIKDFPLNEEHAILKYLEEMLEIHGGNEPECRRAQMFVNGKIIELESMMAANRRKE